MPWCDCWETAVLLVRRGYEDFCVQFQKVTLRMNVWFWKVAHSNDPGQLEKLRCTPTQRCTPSVYPFPCTSLPSPSATTSESQLVPRIVLRVMACEKYKKYSQIGKYTKRGHQGKYTESKSEVKSQNRLNCCLSDTTTSQNKIRQWGGLKNQGKGKVDFCDLTTKNQVN